MKLVKPDKITRIDKIMKKFFLVCFIGEYVCLLLNIISPLLLSFLTNDLHSINEPTIINNIPKYFLLYIKYHFTIENILFMEISSSVQFTIKDVIIPMIAPIMLENIKENVDEKYFNDFIILLLI
jgi:hypothetical protein